MSTDMGLEITTEVALNEVAEALFSNLKYEVLDSDEEQLTIRTDYFLATIDKIVDEDSLSQCWGATANHHVYFFNVDWSEDNNGFREILRIAVDWLDKTIHDIGLVYNGELPLLVRQNGNLILNSAWGWEAEDLLIISVPHEVKKLPVC